MEVPRLRAGAPSERRRLRAVCLAPSDLSVLFTKAAAGTFGHKHLIPLQIFITRQGTAMLECTTTRTSGSARQGSSLVPHPVVSAVPRPRVKGKGAAEANVLFPKEFTIYAGRRCIMTHVFLFGALTRSSRYTGRIYIIVNLTDRLHFGI